MKPNCDSQGNQISNLSKAQQRGVKGLQTKQRRNSSFSQTYLNEAENQGWDKAETGTS